MTLIMQSHTRTTINGGNSGNVYQGDSNQFTMAAGAWTVGAYGMLNSIAGGTGPDTYVISSTAPDFTKGNSITTGTGDAFISLTGNWSQVTVQSSSVVHAAIYPNSSNNTLNLSSGNAVVVDFGISDTIFNASGSDTFLLGGSGDFVQLGGSGNSAVGISDSVFVSGSAGTNNYSFLVGAGVNASTVATFRPGHDHLAVLIGNGVGLTDTGLSPQAVLTGAQLEDGTGPTQASTRFVYNPSTGALEYTPNGSASSVAIPVATLPVGQPLTASDIFVANRYIYGSPVQNTLDSLPSAWNVTDPQPTAPNAVNFGVADQTTGVSSTNEPGQVYTGPVSGLQQQFYYNGPNRVTVSARVDNVFIHGAGNEALAAHGGTNVLDGGLGSSFLSGGTGADGGTDTFFTDARTSAFVWSTVVNFHPGDMVTLFGFVAGQSTYTLGSGGAPGFQGLTLDADLAGTGTSTARVTLAGLTAADENHLSFTTGTTGGIPYLAIIDHTPVTT